MQSNQQVKEVFVTLPMSWVGDLLERVPVRCDECGVEKPGSEVNKGDGYNVCDACVRVRK